MQYELQLNLQQIAALSAAISLWEKDEVKDKVKEFINLCRAMEGGEEVKNEWKKLMKAVLEESNQTVLPPTLENELIHFIVKIGEKVCNWCLHIEIDNEFPFTDRLADYFDKIVWTPYGTVDEVEIFQSNLSKYPNHNIINMYNIACTYALEGSIDDLWSKLSTNMKKHSKKNMYKHSNRHILAYWKYRRDCNLSDLIEYFDSALNLRIQEDPEEYDFIYNPYFSPEENIFWVSVYEGYSNAVKYFWGKLTEEQRSRSIIDCSRMTIMCYDNYDIEDENSKIHKKEKYVEICVFLLNQMNEDQREALFEEELELDGEHAYDMWDVEIDVKGKILIMLLSVWPWQELFIPVLNDMMCYLQYNEITICKLLDAITRKILDEHYLGYSIGNSKYSSMLQTFWSKIPRSMKQKIVDLNWSHFIDFLLIVDDLKSIEMIFNDSDIADVRDKYLEAGKIHYLRSIVNEQYELLDQLMEKICRSEEEKKCFKQKITIWGQSQEGSDFVADHPKSDGPEEGQSNWRCLDDLGFCEFFVKRKQYDSVERFLNWKFEIEDEDEKRKCKEHLKSDKFAIEQVYEIWKSSGTDVDKAKENSTLFLKWLLGSEEKITQFKTGKIINCDQEQLFIDYFVRKDLIYIIDIFLFWCLSSKEEVEKVKQNLSNNVARFICIRNITLGCADKAEKFVRWAFPEKESMEYFIKEFIASNNGIASCYNFLKKKHTPKLRKPRDCIQHKLRILSAFVNFWISPLENVKEFRTKFTSYKFKFNDAEGKENHKIFMCRLEDLEQNTQKKK